MMAKYKNGDVLVPRPYYKGFERLQVLGIDNGAYRCAIMKGTATIAVRVVDENYELVKDTDLTMRQGSG